MTKLTLHRSRSNMKKFIHPTLSILSFAIALTVGAQSFAAGPYCQDVIFSLDYAPNLQKVKTDLQDQIRSQQIPARMTREQQNRTPVVLLNDRTSPLLNNYIQQSMGVQVVYQPGGRNDHGLVRIGNFIADMDAPGYRRGGELHKTGIQWKDIFEYNEIRAGLFYPQRVLIEVSYALNRQESEASQIYHTMRRSAIVRVPFTFGGGQNNLAQPNMLKNAGEHCFIFCSGGNIGTQIREISQNFGNLKLGDIETYLKDSEVESFLDKADQELLSAFKNRNENNMRPDLAKDLPGYEALTNRIFKDLNESQKNEAMNWLIGYRTSKNYQALIRNLRISGDTGYRDLSNPRATAVFIYDNKASSYDFKSDQYAAPGVFSSWTHQNTDAL